MALIAGRADDRVGTGADAALARVGLRAGVAVVAGRAVRARGIRAEAGCRVTRSRVVALIAGRTDDRVGAGTHSALARVGLRAGVAVVAGRAVRARGIRAEAGCRVARSRVVALVARRADHGVGAGAGSTLAGVGLSAGVPVVAGCSVRTGRVRAEPGRRIARAGIVACIGGAAVDGVRSHADAGLTGVGLGARIAVVARRSVRSRVVLAVVRVHVARIGRARVAIVAIRVVGTRRRGFRIRVRRDSKHEERCEENCADELFHFLC